MLLIQEVQDTVVQVRHISKRTNFYEKIKESNRYIKIYMYKYIMYYVIIKL